VRKKLKNSNIHKLILTFVAVIFITAIPAFSAPTEEVKATAIKFILAMGGVVFSSFIIFAGLAFYNKFFVERKNIKFDKEDSLTTPSTVDDSIVFFIKKNKLR